MTYRPIGERELHVMRRVTVRRSRRRRKRFNTVLYDKMDVVHAAKPEASNRYVFTIMDRTLASVMIAFELIDSITREKYSHTLYRVDMLLTKRRRRKLLSGNYLRRLVEEYCR